MCSPAAIAVEPNPATRRLRRVEVLAARLVVDGPRLDSTCRCCIARCAKANGCFGVCLLLTLGGTVTCCGSVADRWDATAFAWRVAKCVRLRMIGSR